MSNKLVKVAKKTTKKSATPQDFRPSRSVEVVADEDIRAEEQRAPKTEIPKSFFDTIPKIREPLAVGARVSLETLLGFLEAAERVLPPGNDYPILSSARLRFDNVDVPRLIVEAGSHSVWTAVVIEAEKTTDDGFQAVMPVRPAKNVLRALRNTQQKVVVGVDEYGVCIGPHTVNFGGTVEDFPCEPVLKPYEARAAIPATYLDDIESRVICARDKDARVAVDLSGILLDFDSDQDGVCHVVATDGHRVHVLRLPRVMSEAEKKHLRSTPPSVVVDAGLFRYLRAVVNREWAALELGATQVVAKGDDFVVVAKAEAVSKDHALCRWRAVIPTYEGFWMVDAQELLRILKATKAKSVDLQVNGARKVMRVSAKTDQGTFEDEVSIRDYGGVQTCSVHMNRQYLIDAVKACESGLLRLEMDDDPKTNSTSAFVVRSDDDMFYAVIMPVRR